MRRHHTTVRFFNITVEANNADYGSVTGTGRYKKNTVTTLTATPASNYRFVEWNDGDTNQSRSVTVTANTVYTATFEVNQYTITVTSNNATMGTVTGSGTYLAGETCVIQASPNQGYVFSSWDDGIRSNPRRFRVTENCSYEAIFKADIRLNMEFSNLQPHGLLKYSILNDNDIVTSTEETINTTDEINDSQLFETKYTIEPITSSGYKVMGVHEHRGNVIWRHPNDQQYNHTKIIGVGMVCTTLNLSHHYPWGIDIRHIFGENNIIPNWTCPDGSYFANECAYVTYENIERVLEAFSVINCVQNGYYNPAILDYFSYEDYEYNDIFEYKRQPLAFIYGVCGKNHNFDNTDVIHHVEYDFDSTSPYKKIFTPVGNEGIVTGNKVFEKTKGTTIKAMPNPGYVFDHWEAYESSTSTQSQNFTGQTLTISGNTPYALFRPIFKREFNVSMEFPTSGKLSIIGNGPYNNGDTVQVGFNTENGWEFVQWSDGSTELTRTIVITADTPTNLVAQAKPTAVPLISLLEHDNISETMEVDGVSATSRSGGSFTRHDTYVNCTSESTFGFALTWSGQAVTSKLQNIKKSSGGKGMTMIMKMKINSISSNGYQALYGTFNNWTADSNNGGNQYLTYYSANGGSQNVSTSQIKGKWVISVVRFDYTKTNQCQAQTYDYATKTLLTSHERTWGWPGETTKPQTYIGIGGLTTNQTNLDMDASDFKLYDRVLTDDELQAVITTY